ncbi:MAG: cation:proton antiporter [Spirochaetaceae bacterium]|nr:cation:proton antiporter [Spirochaetaceae bacterium]
MPDNIFLYLAIIFTTAYAIKLLTNKIKVPEVTGFVILGVILGVSAVNLLTPDMLNKFSSLSTIALGMIAFTIGIELKTDVIKSLGKSIFAIVICESLGAFLVVTLVLNYIYHADPNTTLLLGAVASATAPAATVAVIRQYKAKGPLTSTILAVVGLDDAAALIIYVFVEGFVSSRILGTSISVSVMILGALISIIEAVGLGIVSAIIYVLILKKIKNNEQIMLLLVAFLMGLLGIAEILGVSELLAAMAFGAVLVNTSPVLSKKSANIVISLSPIFITAFFILGGAHLDISLIKNIGVLGLWYFVARSIGKTGGATLGANIGKAPKTVRSLVGFALLPQVGVALALALAINKEFTLPQYGLEGATLAKVVINVLLFTTIITEIVGPLLTRYALQKAGEVNQSDTD